MVSTGTWTSGGLLPLSDPPGKVHGIVSLDPPTVQCDGCLATHSHPHLGIAVLTSGIEFRRHHPGVRLCADCRADCPDCKTDRP